MYSARRVAARVPARLASGAKPTQYQSIIRQAQSAGISSASLRPAAVVPLRSQFMPESIQAQRSQFHQSATLAQEETKKPTTETKTEEPAKEGEKKAEESAKEEGKDEKKEGEEGEKKEGEEGENKEDKKDATPPPPHGNKSPWQVFTETLQTEFKNSKEWNEGTKAIADSAHSFAESERVRKAREAYEASTGKVASATGKVLKTTAGAVGKGAVYAWETPVVKGVRHTVNATADVVDKATKPIRETEAFKSVKNVIDDGSSSRYGGWVEKDERKKKRELREAQQALAGGRKYEVPVEDPK
jgi:import inner membrane translocase subunit TIM44